MINFHGLDDTMLDAKDQSEYMRYRYDVISAAEGVRWLAYLDTAGIPSNGIGFNLRDDNILKLVLQSFGLDTSTTLTTFHNIVSQSYADNTALRTALNAEMANQHKANVAIRSTFAFADGAAGKEEMRAVFDIAVQIYDEGYPEGSNAYDIQGRVNAWLDDIPPSKERVVLVSLSYNGLINAGTSPSLREAVLSGDRAEAWYEIRYNSNSDEQHTVRRYDESDKFGLYDPGSTTLDEAYSIYQTYTMHKDAIFAYEDKYGEGDQSLSQELTQAASLFVDKYREYIENPVRGADRNIDPTNIQVTYPDKTTLNGEDITTRTGSNSDLLGAWKIKLTY